MIIESTVLRILRKYEPSIMLGSSLPALSSRHRWVLALRELLMEFSLTSLDLSGAETIKGVCNLIRWEIDDQPLEDRIYQVITNEVIGDDAEPSTKLGDLTSEDLKGIADVLNKMFGVVYLDLRGFDKDRTLKFVCYYVATSLELNEVDLSEAVEEDISLTKEEEKELTKIEQSELGILSRMIVNYSGPLYNGHSQFTVTEQLPLEDLKELMSELDSYYSKIDCRYSVYASIESDGSGNLSIRNFWEDGNAEGHKDKIIFGFGG